MLTFQVTSLDQLLVAIPISYNLRGHHTAYKQLYLRYAFEGIYLQ